MKEKTRPEVEVKPGNSGGGSTIFDAAPEPESKDVSVSSGPYIETLPVAGMTIGEIRTKFADRFDIDEKSTAIVNGEDKDEAYRINAGEALMFVRHAGEKGANAFEITIDGELLVATSPEGERKRMKLSTLMERTKEPSTGPCILPTGVKSMLSRGPITIMIWEQAPSLQKLSWIAEDSGSPYGPGAKYRDVRIALPYLVIFAVFNRDAGGLPHLVQTDECFFRNEPLKGLGDELAYPALLNCSKWNDPDPLTPLSWICTQHLRPTKLMNSANPGDRFAAGMEAVRYCLLETSFNLSSEHNEGNSWYGASKKIDTRIATIESWEKATRKDPLFVLDIPWIKTGHSVLGIAERIFERTNAVNTEIKSSADLARVIFNA
jgi:hypothetical protein